MTDPIFLSKKVCKKDTNERLHSSVTGTRQDTDLEGSDESLLK